MADDEKVEGCVASAAGPIDPQAEEEPEQARQTRKEPKMNVTVGKEAPDFEASAFVNGSFKNIKLSDYRDKWVFLCFYPGDFTFV